MFLFAMLERILYYCLYGSIKMGINSTTHSQLLTTLGKKPFKNIVEKGENAGNQSLDRIQNLCFKLLEFY